MGLAVCKVYGLAGEWRIEHDGKSENVSQTRESAFEAALMSKIPRTSIQLQQMIIDEMNGMEGCPPELKIWVEPYQRYWRARTNLAVTLETADCLSRINTIAERLRCRYDLLD